MGNQPAAGEYVRPLEKKDVDNNPRHCKKCLHGITVHRPDFQSGKALACHHYENNARCTCDGFYS